MPIRAILFDIDGTLVDSNEQHVLAWAQAFREAGHPQEPNDIRRQIGKSGDLLVPALLPGIDKAEAAYIADAHGNCFKAAYLDHVRPFPHATALIARAKANGCRVLLASSAKQQEIEQYLDLLGARDLVDATVGSDDVDSSKPEPDIFAAALDKAGTAADETLVVGDTIYDVEAAARAGIGTVAVTSGPFSATELKNSGALASYDDVAALLAGFETSPLARGA